MFKTTIPVSIFTSRIKSELMKLSQLSSLTLEYSKSMSFHSSGMLSDHLVSNFDPIFRLFSLLSFDLGELEYFCTNNQNWSISAGDHFIFSYALEKNMRFQICLFSIKWDRFREDIFVNCGTRITNCNLQYEIYTQLSQRFLSIIVARYAKLFNTEE